MVYVIETNLSMSGDKIADHQSRVIEVPVGKNIENLEYDGFHLSCDMVWDNELFYLDSRTKHLAYLCE